MSKKLDYEIKGTPKNLVETEVSEPVKPSSGGFINSVQGWGNTNVDHEHDADSAR
ncbi:hypothetical protein [Algibacillus agarilyticus]|uniref:hypothetical protein n=1 Tax=Algibacillus agarilyticus TaxID=2234133 RepID=UPI0013003F72|nr:hypothetical protein [Algibacillus agarilyticus]